MRAFALLRGRLGQEAGFTLVELVTTCALMGVVMTGVVNILVSGQRASSDGQARLTAQQNVQLAFTRLEYDARCASSATLLNKTGSNGAGVYLVLPIQCTHSTGNVTWCVTSGSLVRTTGTTCSATTNKNTFISNVSTATPFSCSSPTNGSLPQLAVALTVNSTTHNSDKVSASDNITIHNVPSTYNTSSATLPATTLTVNSTSGFPTSGTLNTPNGAIAYTGTTATTFTGASGGSGTLATNSDLVSSTGC